MGMMPVRWSQAVTTETWHWERLENGAPEKIRTSDPQIRSLLLAAAEPVDQYPLISPTGFWGTGSPANRELPDIRRARAHGRPKEKGGAAAALSSCCVAAIAVYAAALITAVGSPSNVSRSERSTTVAISRRRSNLSHRAYTAVTPLRVCASNAPICSSE